ncbi:MAG TPA: CDC27 family protein, partial [Ignavibacteriales bacterium]|nr:CDC27 family protein [Ignavibacteriales bacterium]
SNPLINNNYAYSLAERRVQLDKALEMASLAVEKEPGNSSYLDTKGWVHFQMGEFDKAKELIEKSYKMDEDNAEVVEHLADVLFKIGDKEKAKELWRKAMELGSDNEQLKTKIEKGEL